MALLTFPGAERVLAAHGPTLPQPDQLCGPFSARMALHAVLPEGQVPTIGALAAAAGTAIWPYDVAGLRPAGAPLDRTGWEDLPRAPSVETSGTDAAGLLAGLEATAGDRITVVPVSGAELTTYQLRTLLQAIGQAPHPIGVVANVRTGPIAPPGVRWDVGHFVVLCSVDPDLDEVTVADTYAELGAAGTSPGCRRVPSAALTEALATPPARGLLLLVRTTDRLATEVMVAGAGLSTGIWST
ncbi:MAG: DUF6885 family protein [Ornithinimicrobium sp.]|uniref:DUF6885 family protein n=1 Tax=Ornithinimicrobium sp. TaxID=1977084 RepID=UPI003D9B4540